MIEKFIAIYVFIDDIMIEIGHKEPVNRNSSDSELIAVALIATINQFSFPHILNVLDRLVLKVSGK